MKSDQDRYFICLEHCHCHEQFETPKRICLAALTDDPFDNPKVDIDQTWCSNKRLYAFNFKEVIEDYFGSGILLEEEVDFLEKDHSKNMWLISENIFHHLSIEIF